jgi:hypothetical protein
MIYVFLARSQGREKYLLALSCPNVDVTLCPSACISVSSTGRIAVKFDIADFLRKSAVEIDSP